MPLCCPGATHPVAFVSLVHIQAGNGGERGQGGLAAPSLLPPLDFVGKSLGICCGKVQRFYGLPDSRCGSVTSLGASLGQPVGTGQEVADPGSLGCSRLLLLRWFL